MKMRKIAAAVASMAMIATMAMAVPMSAGAVNYKPEDQATGGTTEIDKYLVLDKDAKVPNVTSKFSIAAGEALTETVNGVACYAGITSPEAPKLVADADQDVTVGADGKATITFDSSDATTPEKNANTKTVVFKTTLADGADKDNDEKFATKTLTISFEGIKFPEPGLYRYIITEEVPTDGGISIPTGHVNQYTLFVTVEDTNGKLVVANKKYVLQEGTAAPTLSDKPILDDNGEDTGTTEKVNANKKTGFTNWYTSHNLMFNKLVAGNQGSRDKYFKFTVKLSNPTGTDALTMTDARKNDQFKVVGKFDMVPDVNAATKDEYKTAASGSTDNPMKIANSNELTQVTDGTETYSVITYEQLLNGKDFYLHSGQNIEIYGIPEGLSYEVSEVKEDYTPAVEIHSGTGLDSEATASDDKTKVTDTKLTDTARLTFTNTKGGTIPTGVLMTVAGSAGIAVIGIAGIIAGSYYLRKKKSEED